MKYILSLTFLCIVYTSYSQDSVEVKKLKKADQFCLDFYTDLWQNTPSNVSLKNFQRGMSYSSFQDYPISTSNFSFAYGVALSFHNLYSDSFITYDSTQKSQFTKISVINAGKYSLNKHTLSYIETPVEIRYRTKSKNPIRFNAGFRIGFLLQEHSKYVGDDYLAGTTNTIKFKQFRHKNFDTFRYGLTLRTGYKWFNVYGYYSLTSIFKKGKGPEMYPISVGISIIIL